MKQLFLVLGFLFLLAFSAEAATRYADGTNPAGCVDGSTDYDPVARTCGGGSETVYVGIDAAQQASDASAVGGDTIIIRGGITKYTGSGENGQVTVKNGASSGNRNNYEGYQNEFPVIDGFTGSPTFLNFRKLIIDRFGVLDTGCMGDATFILLEDVTCRNAGHNGITGLGDSVLRRVRITNNGKNSTSGGAGAYGIYTSSDNKYRNNLIQDSEFDNNGGHGLNCYNFPYCGPITIERTSFHHNGDVGIYISSGGAVTIRNVLVYANGFRLAGGHKGIFIGGASVAVVIQNTNIVNNASNGICVVDATLNITNSIAVGNGAQQLSTGTNCHSEGTGTINETTNITTGVASDYFVDAANGDFELKGTGGSLFAINSGTSLSGSFTDDFDETSRPQCPSGASPCNWDIGAQEFIPGGAPNVPPTVNITGPTSNPTTTVATSTITLSGTASDSDGSVSSMSCTNSRGPSCSVTGLTSWTAFDVPLLVGTNVITITATDDDSDSGNDVITVTYDPGNPGDGLLLAISFDEGTGSTAADVSGNNNHGTISGATWTAAGKYGNALMFDGTNDVVTVADSVTLDEMTHEFSITVEVFPQGTPKTNFRSVVTKNYVQFLYASVSGHCGNGNTLGGSVVNGETTQVVCHATPLPINTWTQLAITFDGSTYKLYKNGGTPVATFAATGLMTPTTGSLMIGASQFGEFFEGRIDNLRVYRHALSQAQVESDRDTPITAPPSGTPRVVKFGAGFKMSTGTKFGFVPE